jgi:hypothetical protein
MDGRADGKAVQCRLLAFPGAGVFFFSGASPGLYLPASNGFTWSAVAMLWFTSEFRPTLLIAFLPTYETASPSSFLRAFFQDCPLSFNM